MKILDNIIEFIVLMFLEMYKMIIIINYIITNIEDTACTVYIVFKTFSSIRSEYNKNNGVLVYKSQ